jgi:C1A family cysteine protease
MGQVNNFGRIYAPPDARDLRFRMMPAMAQINAEVAKPKPRKRAYNLGPLLDQGDTPQCVGYSTRGFLEAAPIMTKHAVEPSATAIYRGAQERDEWPGTNYDGTSVRGAMKYLTDAKEISGYVWGQSLAEAITWMNNGYGTCIVGTNWYVQMSDVDDRGFMREPASNMDTPIGGHAWHVIWYDQKKNALLMRNSWGKYFGQALKNGDRNGFAYVRLEFMERLLREDGEIAAPTQIKIAPVKLA